MWWKHKIDSKTPIIDAIKSQSNQSTRIIFLITLTIFSRDKILWKQRNFNFDSKSINNIKNRPQDEKLWGLKYFCFIYHFTIFQFFALAAKLKVLYSDKMSMTTFSFFYDFQFYLLKIKNRAFNFFF